MHWPELHQLFSSKVDDITSEERRMDVINNPHLVDCFFFYKTCGAINIL